MADDRRTVAAQGVSAIPAASSVSSVAAPDTAAIWALTKAADEGDERAAHRFATYFAPA